MPQLSKMFEESRSTIFILLVLLYNECKFILIKISTIIVYVFRCHLRCCSSTVGVAVREGRIGKQKTRTERKWMLRCIWNNETLAHCSGNGSNNYTREHLELQERDHGIAVLTSSLIHGLFCSCNCRFVDLFEVTCVMCH